MGVGNIIQKNIANGCQTIWTKVPQLPQLNIDLSKVNKPFVNFVALFGLYTLYKSSVFLTKKSIQIVKGQPKVPTKLQMQQKYGQNSWAIIVDCKANQEYCLLLAKKGFNLILCGDQEDIQIAQQRLSTQVQLIKFKVETKVVNWQESGKNIKFYEQLAENYKDLDVSIMVMPRIQKDVECATYEQKIPLFEHIYLMTRYFGPKLKWRSYSSAIIIPSIFQVDQIDGKKNGVTRAVQSGIDSLGRTLSFELKGLIEVISARGSPQNALAGLGKIPVSF